MMLPDQPSPERAGDRVPGSPARPTTGPDFLLGTMLAVGAVGVIGMIVLAVWASSFPAPPVSPVPGARADYEQRPDDPGLAVELAWTLIDADSSAAAVEIAKRATSLAPADPEAHVVLGSALIALERWDDAFDALEEAIRLDPDYGLGHFSMADLHYRRGMWPETEAHARRALELDPRLVRAHGFLAISLLYQDRDDEADAAIDRGIAVAPDDVYLAWLRAEIFDRTARPVEAVAAYRRLAELNPTQLEAWTNIGRLEHILGHYEAAVVALERARDLDPEWFAQADLEQSMLQASRERRPYNR